MQAQLTADGFPVHGVRIVVSTDSGYGSAQTVGRWLVLLDPTWVPPPFAGTTDADGNTYAAWDADATHLLRHELLHASRMQELPGSLRDLYWRGDAVDWSMEEAAAEAITRDLSTDLPPSTEPFSFYGPQVVWIRAASAHFTGSPWWSTAARDWRREFLYSSPEHRRRLVAGFRPCPLIPGS
jgi:hypothetical protein